MFIVLRRKDKEETQATECMVNLDNICTIREAKIEVDGDMEDGSYIETTGGFHFYCLETVEDIRMILRIILPKYLPK